MGGGSVEAGGGIVLEKQKPASLKFSITGRDLGLNYPEGLRSQIDTDLQWTGTLSSSELNGTVRVLRSLYNEDIDYRDRLINTLLSQKEDLSTPSTVAGRVKLNLQVQTVQDFRLKNNIARLRSGGDFQITGTAAQPRIGGQLLVREGGLVFFEGNDFVVEHAVLSFFGTTELNPSFDATLSTTATAKDSERNLQDYDITVRLRGPLDNYQLELTSNPPLSDSQIYSVLLTGELRELGETAGLIFQRQLAAYLSGRLFFDFQKRIAGALGFSQFEILPPDLISSEQDPGVRLIVAKELASGFEVQYSTLLSQHTDSTWIATYRLKNRLSLRFVDQEDGEYTGGLRHSLRFGGASGLHRTTPRTPNIESLQIENESVLDLETIREKLGVREGQKYDPWKLEDQAEELKKLLQKRGFLFPTVEIQETLETDVRLLIRIKDGGQRTMKFSGVQVPEKSIDKYKQWWSEGLSESVVLTQITDDLQSQLFKEGHHKAIVRAVKSEADGSILYAFEAEAGSAFERVKVRYSGNSSYPDEELERDLLTLYGSPELKLQESVHRFASYKDKVTALYVRKGFLDAKVESAGLTFATRRCNSQRPGPGGAILPYLHFEGFRRPEFSTRVDGTFENGPRCNL